MKKILIISYYYLQQNEVATIRIRALTRFLPEFGWEPLVISGQSQENLANKLHSLENKKNFQKKGILNRLIHFGKKNPFLLKLILPVWQELLFYPDALKKWRQDILINELKKIQIQDYHAVISSSGPPSTHIIANYIQKKYFLPWIADFRDLWTQGTMYNHSPVRKWFERKFEKDCLKSADVLISVSEPLVQKLKEFHHRESVYCITNGFDPDFFNPGIKVNAAFSLTYTGFIYKNKQDPEFFFKIISELLSTNALDQKNLIINFYGKHESSLQESVDKFGLEQTIRIHDQIPHSESIEVQRESQILLFFNWNDPKETGIYTGKLFEYLAARRPILSIGNASGGVVKDLLDKTKTGMHVSDEDELKKYLIESYRVYKKTGTVHYYGIESEILKYSHREMARKFADVLDKISL